MTEVTLIGEHLAKKGLEFAFGGCLSRCQSCEIKNSCCGLEKNKWYRVTDVRDKKHGCKIHHGDVKVVEVEEMPIETAVSGRSVIEGSVLTIEEKDCSDIDCKYYRLCHPVGTESGEKYNVEEVGEKIDCEKGKDLKKVKLV